MELPTDTEYFVRIAQIAHILSDLQFLGSTPNFSPGVKRVAPLTRISNMNIGVCPVAVLPATMYCKLLQRNR